MEHANNLSQIKILLLASFIGLLAGCSPVFWNSLGRGVNRFGGGRLYKAVAVAKGGDGASVSAYAVSSISFSDAEMKALSKCKAKRKRKNIQNRCKLMNRSGVVYN